MPAPALRGGHGQSRSGHGRSMKNSYLCAPRLGVSVKGCQPFASDVPDSRRAALFDLPGLKVKEFTFMPGAGAVIFAATAGRAEWHAWRGAEMSKLSEARSLMTEALRVANDVDQDAPPELHAGLEHIRDLLDWVLERIDGVTDPGPDLARLTARA